MAVFMMQVDRCFARGFIVHGARQRAPAMAQVGSIAIDMG